MKHEKANLFYKACLFLSPGRRVDFTVLTQKREKKKKPHQEMA
jgi:hypothetical protein